MIMHTDKMIVIMKPSSILIDQIQ